MKYQLVVFDLDGTLLNTLDDLAAAGNYCLAAHGFPVHPIPAYKKFIGSGIYNLIKRSLPEEQRQDDALIRTMSPVFAEYYQAHSADKTAPYDGVLELLERLREDGCKVAVYTNKPHDRAVELCRDYFPDLVQMVCGQREGYAIKPNPTVLYDILAYFDTSKAQCVYVGDSGVDIATGKNAEVDTIAVSWGFCTPEELEAFGAGCIVDTVPLLLEKLL